ncbi:unnamed protein product [Rhizophagus irregularis]|nr:unnamed protein product [Rhizophagus irregularis]
MTLPLRELGKTGVKISVIGLGCMGMSEFYGSSDEQENIKVLNRALELGCNFWDTSDAYRCGANEILISKILKDRVSNVSGKPEYARQACENSLKRLEIDCIDLYYQHRVDPETPIEDTVGALAELVKEGKIKYIGLSECFAATLRRAHKIHPISAVQVNIHNIFVFFKNNTFVFNITLYYIHVAETWQFRNNFRIRPLANHSETKLKSKVENQAKIQN